MAQGANGRGHRLARRLLICAHRPALFRRSRRNQGTVQTSVIIASTEQGDMHNGVASESKGSCCGSHFSGSHDLGIDERTSALPRNNGTRHDRLPAAANPVDRAVASLEGTSSVVVRALRLGGPPSTTSTRTRSLEIRRYRVQPHDQFVHVKPSAAKRLLASSALLPPKSLAASTRAVSAARNSDFLQDRGRISLFFTVSGGAHCSERDLPTPTRGHDGH